MRIQTTKGKQIDVISESDLPDYKVSDAHIRTYCPVHGSDHQKSLSIDRSTGWGRCFNASCNAVVLIQEFNPDVAIQLLQRYQPPFGALEPAPVMVPMPKKPAIRPAADWQTAECTALLRQNDLLCQALLRSEEADCWQVQAYLETRKIPLEIAYQERSGYFSTEFLLRFFQPALARWSNRLLFPLTSPTGRGYAGRSLWHWQPHMDEIVHKAVLDEPGAPSRWLKTNPAGWFCAPPISFGDRIIVVEGPFDRLALLSAGFASNEVVALVGTTLQPDWLPEQVKHIILALDSDEGGLEGMWRLVDRLSCDDGDREVYLCPPPDDQRGKDWGERWRRFGVDGLAELFRTFDFIV